jgi:hypothetical protein
MAKVRKGEQYLSLIASRKPLLSNRIKALTSLYSTNNNRHNKKKPNSNRNACLDSLKLVSHLYIFILIFLPYPILSYYFESRKY